MELRLSRRQTRGKLRARIYRCFHFRLGAATSAHMGICTCVCIHMCVCVCSSVYRGCFRFMLKQFHVELALRGIKAVGLIIYKLAPRTDAPLTHANTNTFTRTWHAERRS